jgi:preprotein translocase subunit SecA
LRAYGQRDPLVEYKKEGLQMYKRMEQSITEEMYRLLPHMGGLTISAETKNLQEIHDNAQIIGAEDGSRKAQSVSSEDKVGRNEKVVVTKNGEEKEIKHKKLEEHLKDGWIVKK